MHVGAPAGFDGGGGVAALCAHARDEQRHGGRQGPHALDLGGVGRAHHQAQLPIEVPVALRELRDVFKQTRLAVHRGQALVLKIVAAGVGGAAEQKRAFAVALQIGLHRIETHVGRERDGVGAKALKGLDGVLLGGRADVAALGVQDDRHMGCHAAHVGHQTLQLLFGAVRGEVGDLGFEGHGQVGRGVDDGGAKVEDLAGVALPMARKFGGFWVQAHAEQGGVLALGALEHVKKGHAPILEGLPCVPCQPCPNSPRASFGHFWL